MPKIKNKNEPMQRTMLGGFAFVRSDEGEAEGENSESRTIELSFSSETPVRRWFGDEILLHDSGAVDLSRLQEIGVVLFNHDSDKPIGAVLSVELDEAERRCKATITLDTDEQSELIYQKIRSGTLKGVSVGYRIWEYMELEANEVSSDGRFTGSATIATRWEPYEISIVSVPADADVGVGRQIEKTLKNEGDAEIMPKKNENVQVEESVQNDNNAREAEPTNVTQEEAVQAERQRTVEIAALCRNFDMDADEYIRSGTSVEEVNKLLLMALLCVPVLLWTSRLLVLRSSVASVCCGWLLSALSASRISALPICPMRKLYALL